METIESVDESGALVEIVVGCPHYWPDNQE